MVERKYMNHAKAQICYVIHTLPLLLSLLKDV